VAGYTKMVYPWSPIQILTGPDVE